MPLASGPNPADPTEPGDGGAATPTVLFANRSFGEYELLEQLGRGGMGIVYRARQVPLDRVVALKMIASGRFASPEEVRRFEVEARNVAGLDHPNIVPLYEVGVHDGHPFFTMKLIEGGRLADHVGRFASGDSRDAARLIAVAARAVHYAHERGVLHRDLKPGNVLLDLDGQPQVTDFGLARQINDVHGQTLTGELLGTPRYMAPEQARGERTLTVAADVYGLGMILYELLTGRPAFRADSPLEVLRLVREAEPPAPSSLVKGGRIPRDLEAICLKCLEKEPARRYPSAGALADDLDRFLHDLPVRARPPGAFGRMRKFARRNRGLVVATTAVILALAIGLAFATAGFVNARRHQIRAQTVSTFLQEILDLIKRNATATDVLAVVRRFDGSPAARDPEVAAPVRLALADVYRSMGLLPEAESQLSLALDASESYRGEDHLDTALVLSELADLTRAEGNLTAADGYGRRASDIFRRRAAQMGLEQPREVPPAMMGLWIRIARATERLNAAPENPALRTERGTLYARAGAFDRAEDDYHRAINLDGNDHWRWFFYAFLCLHNGHDREYDVACRVMADRFNNTSDPWVPERTAKARFAAPHPHGDDASAAVHLVRQGATPSQLPWLRAAEGMGQYRAGRFDEAVQSLEAARRDMVDQPAPCATASFFLAMAYYKMHLREEAVEALRLGDADADRLPKPGVTDLGDGVENWILCRRAREEVEELKNPVSESQFPSTRRAP